MAPSELERIEVLEVSVAELIPREELTRKLDATAAAASAARDVSTRIEVLLQEKIIPMVEEDHRTLRGQNGNPRLVADNRDAKRALANINRFAVWALAGLAVFGTGLLWALITHRIILEEVVATVTPH